MIGTSAYVLTTHWQTRRQVARALHSGGIGVHFIDAPSQIRTAKEAAGLLVIDCDSGEAGPVEEALLELERSGRRIPVVLLSVGADKQPLLKLIETHDVGNLVAKHGAIRAAYPVLDERELLVTCEKVIRRNIFGIDKYVGSWGIVLHTSMVTAMKDKGAVLDKFQQFLAGLDCPPSVIPSVLTVADELILNAAVHAPALADGTPKYEHTGATPDLVLEPKEYVSITYGCDGQRLMFAVTDNFGRLDKRTLCDYLFRGFRADQLTPETKTSGAGLGLALAVRNIHQLIFNVQDTVRTEVIAGWYLRVNSAAEFRQVGKSFNIFWLPGSSAEGVQPGRSPKDAEAAREAAL